MPLANPIKTSAAPSATTLSANGRIRNVSPAMSAEGAATHLRPILSETNPAGRMTANVAAPSTENSRPVTAGECPNCSCEKSGSIVLVTCVRARTPNVAMKRMK